MERSREKRTREGREGMMRGMSEGDT